MHPPKPTFDCVLIVRSSSSLPPPRAGDQAFHFYEAGLDDEGTILDVCVAYPENDVSAVPHPSGARIRVFGNFEVVDTTFLVTASSVLLLTPDEPPAPAPARDHVQPMSIDESRASPKSEWPVLVFHGVVVAVHPAPRDNLTFVDVAVGSRAEWARDVVTFQCCLDHGTFHLSDAKEFDVGSVVVLSGVFTGVVDERLVMEVHDIHSDLDEVPCRAQAIMRDNLALRKFPDNACRWLAGLVKGTAALRTTSPAAAVSHEGVRATESPDSPLTS